MSQPTRGLLADGREIIYYHDGVPGFDVAPPDPREIQPVDARSELRYDRVQDEWVIVASHRQDRTFLPPVELCPLCPSGEGRATEIPATEYDVVVFQNRFPSLVPTTPEGDDTSGLFPTSVGNGRCEVICFSSDHEAAFHLLGEGRLGTIAGAVAQRTEELSQIPGVEYVMFFENRGEEIGVTLTHPHGQIYAYPFLPPSQGRALEAERAHRQLHGVCLSCQLLQAEIDDGSRLIIATPGFVALVPFAARWPYQARILARRHVPDLASMSPPERTELFVVQAAVLAALDSLFSGSVPYIASLFQAPVRLHRDLAHLRVDIVSPRRAEGKLKYLAGSETAAGAFINDIAPEEAAGRLRRALDTVTGT